MLAVADLTEQEKSRLWQTLNVSSPSFSWINYGKNTALDVHQVEGWQSCRLAEFGEWEALRKKFVQGCGKSIWIENSAATPTLLALEQSFGLAYLLLPKPLNFLYLHYKNSFANRVEVFPPQFDASLKSLFSTLDVLEERLGGGEVAALYVEGKKLDCCYLAKFEKDRVGGLRLADDFLPSVRKLADRSWSELPEKQLVELGGQVRLLHLNSVDEAQSEWETAAELLLSALNNKVNVYDLGAPCVAGLSSDLNLDNWLPSS